MVLDFHDEDEDEEGGGGDQEAAVLIKLSDITNYCPDIL